MGVIYLCLGLLALSNSARLNDIRTAWDREQRDTKSLVVEFDYQHTDLLRRREHKAKGAFCLLRNNDGSVSASYSLEMPVPEQSFYGLLDRGNIYWLEPHAKTAIRFTPEDPSRFLARHLFPFVVFLDRERAEETVKIGVEKRDPWYTYLSVESKRQPWKPGYFDGPFTGTVAVLDVDTPEVTRNMPRTIQFQRHDHEIIRYDIRKWRVNAKEGIDLTQLTKPEDRKEWKVKSGLFDLLPRTTPLKVLDKY